MNQPVPPPDPVFTDRVAIVTGASSGIGAATATALAARGAMVALFARSAGKLAEVAARSRDRMLAVTGDVGSPEDVERLFSETEARFGDCDILINCAGMIDPHPFAKTSVEAWDRMFAVNTRGAFLTARRALPAMIARRSGTIVNVASISGVIGPKKFPGFVSYCASKAAVISMTEALAAEVARYGIRVNCVSPGSVDTEMLRRAGPGLVPDMTPEEVARTILFLASPESRPMSGQNLHVYSA
ncbi:MAG TPA: SDR family oxidoreductase [Thermoanaerobaculia bacterium]|nr:SDR family oxidoreductase [Thermoanaerobaculia bacterium]